MTGATVVAPQTADVVTSYVACMRDPCPVIWRIGLGHVTRMAVMMMLRMISRTIMGMGRIRCHVVLAEWHRHGCIPLQREPQHDCYRQNGSPAIHKSSIRHDIWLFQSSELASSTKVP